MFGKHEDVAGTMSDLVKTISIQVSSSGKFRRFQNMYRNDRIAFAWDILGSLGKSIAFYQEEILGLLDEGHTRIAVRGPHGLGKTFLAATLVHHSVLTAESDAKTITTATAWRQLEKYLWPEIHKHAKYLRWDLIGRDPYNPLKELLGSSIRLEGRTVEAFAVASDDHNTIEGAHGRQLFYVFDEAKAIPRPTWNAAEGAFSNAKNVKIVSYEEDNTANDLHGFHTDIESETIIGSSHGDVLKRHVAEDYDDGTSYDDVLTYFDNAVNIRTGVLSEKENPSNDNIEYDKRIDESNRSSVNDSVGSRVRVDVRDDLSIGVANDVASPLKPLSAPRPLLRAELESSHGTNDTRATNVHGQNAHASHETFGGVSPLEPSHEASHASSDHMNPNVSSGSSTSANMQSNISHERSGANPPKHGNSRVLHNATQGTNASSSSQITSPEESPIYGDRFFLSENSPAKSHMDSHALSHETRANVGSHVIDVVTNGSVIRHAVYYAEPRVPIAPHETRRTSREKIVANMGVTERAFALAISTPGDPSGQFYDIHMRKPGYEDWYVRHVTVEEAIRAGRVSRDWVDQRRRQWGETSSIFQNRVLGEFADSSEEGIVPLSWVRAACERWKEWKSKGAKEIRDGRDALGVDVARGGDDKTVIAHTMYPHILELWEFSKIPTTMTAGHVKRLSRGKEIHIEMDGGLGASVYDMLKEQGIPSLKPITVSANTPWRDRSKELRFVNVRAAMWWQVRELLDPQYGAYMMVPPVDKLILDLTTPRWEIMKDATVRLESKDSIRQRLGRSTDYGDAACIALWNASSGGGFMF